MRATNKANRPGKTVTITVGGLTSETVKALRAEAKENHRSLAGQIRALIESALEKVGTAR
jgi:hypothetical protein